MRRRLAVGILLAALLGACGTPAEEVTSGSTTTAAPGAGWEQLPPAPLSPRGGAVLVDLGGERLLIVGGDTSPGCHDTLVIPQEAQPEPPSAAGSSGAAVISTSSAASCVGPEKDTRLRDGAIFDRSAGTWKQIADSPVPLSDPSEGVVVGDRVYLWSLPSVAQRGPQQGAWLAYDVKDDKWHELAEPPVKQDPYIGVIPAGESLIAFHTSQEYGPIADLVYDPKADSWREMAADPLAPSYDRVMVWTETEVVLLAREVVPNPGSERPSLVRAAAYDPATEKWRRLPDSEIAGGYDWWWSGKRVVNPAHGGSDGGESGNYGRTYPHGGMLDPATGEWSSLPPVPEIDASCEEDRQAIGGGPREHAAGPDTVVLDGWALHVIQGRWEPLPCNPPRGDFAYASTWALDGVVTFGGYDTVAEPGEFPTDYKFTNDAWLWRPE